MAAPIVYGTPLSTYVRTVRMTLMEKGVDYSHVDVGVLDGECRGTAHLARNPFGKVPALDHDGVMMYETNAIVRYIDQAFDGAALTPADAGAQARMNQVMSIHDNNGYDSMVLDVVAYYFFADFVGGQDDTRLAAGKERAALCLAEFERLMGDDPFIAGANVGLADLYIAPSYFYVTMTPAADELLGPRAKLAAWWQRMSERASTQATAPSFD